MASSAQRVPTAAGSLELAAFVCSLLCRLLFDCIYRQCQVLHPDVPEASLQLSFFLTLSPVDHASSGHRPNMSNSREGGGDEEEDCSSSLCDFEAGPFSPQDKAVASAGHALMAIAADTLKLLSRQLLLGGFVMWVFC